MEDSSSAIKMEGFIPAPPPPPSIQCVFECSDVSSLIIIVAARCVAGDNLVNGRQPPIPHVKISNEFVPCFKTCLPTIPLNDVADLLGHSSLDTTRIYTKASEKDLASAVARLETT